MNRLNVSVLSSYSSINEDSTLRGHYPLETELLKEGIEKDCKS